VLVYSVHNYPKGFDPGSDQVGSGGTIPPALSGALGYASTTTTATIYWDGTNSSERIVLLRDDGAAVRRSRMAINRSRPLQRNQLLRVSIRG
jgi:hypothetical protein